MQLFQGYAYTVHRNVGDNITIWNVEHAKEVGMRSKKAKTVLDHDARTGFSKVKTSALTPDRSTLWVQIVTSLVLALHSRRVFSIEKTRSLESGIMTILATHLRTLASSMYYEEQPRYHAKGYSISPI